MRVKLEIRGSAAFLVVTSTSGRCIYAFRPTMGDMARLNYDLHEALEQIRLWADKDNDQQKGEPK